VACRTTICAALRHIANAQATERVNGHNWRVGGVAARESLDRFAVVIDFGRLKEVLGEVASRFHYQDVNEHPAFAGQSPSAEAVARYFFLEVRKGLGGDGSRLRRVRVWEAPGCSATYSE